MLFYARLSEHSILYIDQWTGRLDTSWVESTAGFVISTVSLTTRTVNLRYNPQCGREQQIQIVTTS